MVTPGMFTTALRAPKLGSAEAECEDAHLVLPAEDPDTWRTEPVLVAVADGASESLLSGPWAALLTTGLLAHVAADPSALDAPEAFADALARAGLAWRPWLADYVARREAAGRPIAWYEQPGLDRGPHATALAARFAPDADGRTTWAAAALGDSCLFHTRGADLLHAFPLADAGAFDSSPGLVNALTTDTALLARHTRTASGAAEQGDQFFLCTDALAAWFLREAERGGAPWDLLAEHTRGGDPERFAAWLEAARAAGEVRNDDVTLVHVDLG
ncbi:hypothetical protein KCV87_35125 [Actinosynnema pretiosum subsp. pretiosum]|uniref:PPM-type phosphatase domain-containing protein n=1 Tax=Actinosynnema pretiosum subsp. pretiosum TaxID=103721 RepID=A0AA45R4C0_9PSEU|nr:hypothetical protein APASM_4128 [Actinosynnema pretiosum subsp. pretiosum]QUF04473.1 hypothetical protein KCV87_35125 [Actinosynnema pretiosum subsp. pretiosum]